MITIICSTNRENANSRKVSNIYANILKEKGADCKIVDLIDLPRDFIFSALFDNTGQQSSFNEIHNVIDNSEKLVFIVPEYNGSFPGILKAFLDGLKYPDSLKDKTAALVGLSSGSMGGALAISHLTDVLHYFGTIVLPAKPRLSGIGKSFDGEVLTNELYMKLLEEQATQLIKFG